MDRRRRLAAILVILALTSAAGLGCTHLRAGRLYTAGSAALDRGDTQTAIAALEEARSLTPDVSEVRNHLGIAYAADERHAAALSEFQRAVDLDCDNQAAKRNLRAAQHHASGLRVEALPTSSEPPRDVAGPTP